METVKQAAVKAISILPETAKVRDIEMVLKELGRTFDDEMAETGPITLSFLEAAKEFVGCIKNAPPDLSVNKTYLDGFGL